MSILPVWIQLGELHSLSSPLLATTAGGMDEESLSSLVCGMSKMQIQHMLICA